MWLHELHGSCKWNFLSCTWVARELQLRIFQLHMGYIISNRWCKKSYRAPWSKKWALTSDVNKKIGPKLLGKYAVGDVNIHHLEGALSYTGHALALQPSVCWFLAPLARDRPTRRSRIPAKSRPLPLGIDLLSLDRRAAASPRLARLLRCRRCPKTPCRHEKPSTSEPIPGDLGSPHPLPVVCGATLPQRALVWQLGGSTWHEYDRIDGSTECPHRVSHLLQALPHCLPCEHYPSVDAAETTTVIVPLPQHQRNLVLPPADEFRFHTRRLKLVSNVISFFFVLNFVVLL
jgi:hypothetical protein